MNKTCLLLLALFFLLFGSVTAQNVAALDAKNGFRSYKFGMHLSEIPDLVKLKTKQPTGVYGNAYTKYYEKKNEKLSVGTYKLSSVVYTFYKDRLMEISITVSSIDDARGMLGLLQNMYGKPESTDKIGSLVNMSWQGKKVALNYNEDTESKFCTVSYSSVIILGHRSKDDDRRREFVKRGKAAKDREVMKEL